MMGRKMFGKIFMTSCAISTAVSVFYVLGVVLEQAL